MDRRGGGVIIEYWGEQIEIGKTKIKILDMVDEPTYTGKVGIITSIDDIGQLHGTWGGLAINCFYGDSFEILE